MYYDSIDTATEHRAQWLCKVGRFRSKVLNMTMSHTCPTQLQRHCGVLRSGVLTSDAYIDVPSWII